MPRPTASSAWQLLQSHCQQLANTPLVELFEADASRATGFSLEEAGLYLDYSKQPVTAQTLGLLAQLARDAGLQTQIKALYEGRKINSSEDRAAWHTALRAGDDAPDEVKAELARIEDFTNQVRSGTWSGHTGKAIRDVVNLGVGGSDLGPRLVCHALSGTAKGGPRVHFVANADGPELAMMLRGLDPDTTLFIVVSKSFGTAETRANAAVCFDWLSASGADDSARAHHFVTVSTKQQAAAELGLPAQNHFRLWDWVGGRFSLWSAAGMGIALQGGMPVFRQLLAGARTLDAHFRDAPLESNMPVLLGLIGVWQRNFLGNGQQVVVPYSHYLEYLPAWLQQLEMESNGKRVDRDSQLVDYATGASIWGQVGTNAQHAFLQWLQQGTTATSIDFVLPLTVPLQSRDQAAFMVANCLAQSAALMCGHDPESGDLERVLPGNRGSSTLMIDTMDAYHLGALLALYEHKVFVQSVIWHINAFDQWGVEHGKRMASGLIKGFKTGEMSQLDPSTLRMAQRFLAAQEQADKPNN